MSRQSAQNPVGHLDPKAVAILVDNLSHLDHPRGTVQRLVQLDGNGPAVVKVKKDIAEAVLHHLWIHGYELKRRRGRG